MTAQVYIVLNDIKNALLVPSSALSTKPASSKTKNSKANATTTSQPKPTPNQTAPRLQKLNLTAEQQQLIQQGKATLSVVRVLQADGSALPTQVLIGVNNRINAQVLAGVKDGDQVVIADSADTSASTANSKNSRRNGPPMGM